MKLLLTLVVCGCLCFVAVGEATAQGRWQTLPYLMPINPVHMAFMNNGKVLVVAGSGYAAANTRDEAAVWDSLAGTIARQPLAWDMFCNGMVALPDGRVFINVGSLTHTPLLREALR